MGAPDHQLLETAAAYRNAGLSVLPAHPADKYAAVKHWKPYQDRLPTEAETDAWFANGHDALCLVCGKVSGNLEMMDFDNGGELFSRWAEEINRRSPGLIDRLVTESSQSGGRHAVYRSSAEVNGSMKLAQRRIITPTSDPVFINGKEYIPRKDKSGQWHVILTLIETRGEGGLFLCAPSPGYRLLQGDFTSLPVLSEEERETLLMAAWELNEYVPEVINGQRIDKRSVPSPASAPGLRPGDDFNHRGDMRAVLAQHGWALAKPGENEYWRRPGKTAGWSATLKGRVFYVFSSNAAPFEPNRGYSPFAVYSLLNHGGDFEQAARSLRAEGFGGDSLADSANGADISAIMRISDGQAAPAPDITDPGPLPEHLFGVPGFVKMVCDFTLAHAPYPSPGLAFCGAMALQSYLCARKVRTPGDLRPNIYLLALASSGTGKDFPRKVNSRVLFEIGHLAALGDKFASGEGIQDALVRSNAMLFQNDEMDGVLRQINLDRENKRESIPNILLTLYTSANDVYPVRVKAGQKETVHVDQPHLTLFGTATPQYFYESLSQRMLTNGLFARMMIVDIGKRCRGQRPGSARDVPESIIETARWWVQFAPGQRSGGNLFALHPEPYVVPFPKPSPGLRDANWPNPCE